ncbi:E3 ubiquitin-protein ligase ZNRF4 [Rhynchocyon petersi]
MVTQVCLILLALLAPSRAMVRAILENNSSTVDFADLPALFGIPLAPQGLRGYLMEAKPANACQPIERPPTGNGSLVAIVLIRRFDCTFYLKVLHAQRAGFEAAIVHNVHSDDLVSMAHVYEDLREQIAIPSVFVGEAASQDLLVIARCEKSAHILLLPNASQCGELDCRPVLTMTWRLGRVLALLVATTVLRSVWQRLCGWWCRRPASSSPARQKARVRTFTRHDDLCAICLDEYEEGDQLKILPCSHTYHCKCIDPWLALVEWRTCPVCKQSVAGTGESSDSTTESFGDEDLSTLPGHQWPIWAIQAGLRSRRLELLARDSLNNNPCSDGSQGLSSERSPQPR